MSLFIIKSCGAYIWLLIHELMILIYFVVVVSIRVAHLCKNVFGIQNCFLGTLCVKMLQRNVEVLLQTERSLWELWSWPTQQLRWKEDKTSWERITRNTLGRSHTHTHTHESLPLGDSWRKKWKKVRGQREKKRQSSPGTWPCIVPQAFGPRTCCTPWWLCRSNNCPRWPALTPRFFVRSLSMAVGEPHPHSQGC